MTEEFEKAKNLFKWYKLTLGFLGVWPLNKTYFKYIFWSIYLLFHISMECYDLYTIFGMLDLMVLNLGENALEMMIFVKMSVLRFSVTLANLMKQIVDDVEINKYESQEEANIYLHYNRIAKRFFFLWLTMGSSAAIAYHMKPLEFRIKAVLRNESVPFVLPYRTRLYFEVNDSQTFWLVWVFQAPMMYIHMIHSVMIGYIFALVLHVCGKLSVLVHRIKNIDLTSYEENQSYNLIFRDIVARHRHILRMAKDIEKIFQLVLLEELIISTVIVGTASYSVILNIDADDKGVFISSLIYGSTMLVLLYGYCVAGEYLVVESGNLYDAYYHCQWYKVSDSFKKQLIICMIGAKKPIQLTGGGYYVFSLFSFTGILKTTAGYISMLRNMQ